MLKIRTKLWSSYILVSCFVAFAIGGINLLYSWRVTKVEARQRLIDYSNQYALELENEFEKLEIYASILEGILVETFNMGECYHNAKGMETYKKEVAPLIKQLCEQLDPLSLWLIFHQDVAPGSHGVSFFKRNGLFYREAEYSPADYDLTSPEMLWWVNAMKYGAYWTEPYYWANWDMELITYAKKVEIEGAPIAAVGSDFEFKAFRQALNAEVVYKTGYLYLLNDSLDLIVHPKHQGTNLVNYLGGDDYKIFIAELDKGRNGVIEYLWEGEKKITGFVRMSNGWVVGTAIPYQEVTADFRTLRNITVLIVLFVLVASWILAFFLGRSFSNPVSDLVTLFRKGAQGDLSVRSQLPAKDEIGELGNFFNMFMESMEQMIASLNQSQQQLEVAKLKAEESEKLKTVFLGNISHEIRTPLNAILGFTRILIQKDLVKETREIYLHYLQESTDKLIQLIDGLIDFAKIEVRQLMLKEQVFVLEDLFSELQSDYAFYKEGVGFIVDLTKNEKDTKLRGDKERIEQVLHLLIDNAFKFTNEGTVTCGYKKEENQWIFYVKDTGIGIDPKLGNVIFKKFRQGDERTSRAYGGVGMGLSLAKALVDLMQGRIWFHAEKEGGTCFFFSIKEYVKKDTKEHLKHIGQSG